MSISDPLADMISRIKNGQAAGKKQVIMPSSKLKISVCRVLKNEGYIEDYIAEESGKKTVLIIQLKYFKGMPVITELYKVSKPGKRVYYSMNDLPNILGGLGVAIVSTSKGVLTEKEAREAGHGGEVLCTVS